MMASPALDADGYLASFDDWTQDMAQRFALEADVTLSTEHWSVVDLLRRFYQNTEVSPDMRALVRLVRQDLGPDCGNSIYLMQLFGPSPAKTATRIAGLPRPTLCI